MTIINGYTTLAIFKDRFFQQRTYTATTIGFHNTSPHITDSALGLARFPTGSNGRPTLLRIAGAVTPGNNGQFTIDYNHQVIPGQITTVEAVTTEAAGASITITDITDTVDDVTIEAIITAASRAVERYCGRTFYQSGTVQAPETRCFTSPTIHRCYIDDIQSISSLTTDDGSRTYSTTWTTTDYDFEPFNAALFSRPYTTLSVTPEGDYSFPLYAKGVKISGVWGWPAVPADVQEATIILSLRLFKRKDSPVGVIGANEFGQLTVTARDPDVIQLLNPYRRIV